MKDSVFRTMSLSHSQGHSFYLNFEHSLRSNLSCPSHNFVLHGGIRNKLPQMIIMVRRCAACKNMFVGQMSRLQF